MSADADNVDSVRARSLAGRRFVIVGAGRLTLAVARLFHERNADLTIVVPPEHQADGLSDAIIRDEKMRGGLQVVRCDSSLSKTLTEIDLGSADGLLALSEEGDYNVRVALAAARVSGDRVPIVLRAFDPTLAEAVEGIGAVRRAYSMSHLSAPFFVAAALLDHGSENVLTMRAGEGYVTVCRLAVPPARSTRSARRTRLAATFPKALAAKTGCHVLARRLGDGPWRVVGEPAESERGDHSEPELQAGEEILLGGPLLDVLDVLRQNTARLSPAASPAVPRRNRRQRRQERAHPDPASNARADVAGAAKWTAGRIRSARTPVSALWVKSLLLAFLAVTIAILVVPQHDVADALYSWVNTVVGHAPDTPARPGKFLEVVIALGLLAGGIAFGIAIALAAAVMIERRISDTMQSRVKRMTGHIVVVGLNDVAFAVTELLWQLRIACVVVDPHPELDDAASVRYVSLLHDHAPVIRGELSKVLERARIDRAAALIACSESNLANLEACLRAKRGRRGGIRTVVRLFDEEDVASNSAGPRDRQSILAHWGVDESFAAVEKAADAFVEGALHRGVIRAFAISGESNVHMQGIRWPRHMPIPTDNWRPLAARGVHMIARISEQSSVARSPYCVDAVGETDAGILVGTAAAMEELVERLERDADSRSAPIKSVQRPRKSWPPDAPTLRPRS